MLLIKCLYFQVPTMLTGSRWRNCATVRLWGAVGLFSCKSMTVILIVLARGLGLIRKVGQMETIVSKISLCTIVVKKIILSLDIIV